MTDSQPSTEPYRPNIALRVIAFGLWGLVIASLLAVNYGPWRRTRPRFETNDPIETGAKSYGKAPDFELIERSGRTVTRADLDGSVWVAAFIFTRCHMDCPMVTGTMAELRATLPEAVKLVSFDVDPEHDDPAVLREYADRHKAPADSWWFLTGEKEAIHTLIREGFRLAIAEDNDPKKLPGERILHSPRLVLVDRDGTILGYFACNDRVQIDALRRKAERLVAER